MTLFRIDPFCRYSLIYVAIFSKNKFLSNLLIKRTLLHCATLTENIAHYTAMLKVNILPNWTYRCFYIFLYWADIQCWSFSHIFWSGWLPVYIKYIHTRFTPQSVVFQVNNSHSHLSTAHNPVSVRQIFWSLNCGMFFDPFSIRFHQWFRSKVPWVLSLRLQYNE